MENSAETPEAGVVSGPDFGAGHGSASLELQYRALYNPVQPMNGTALFCLSVLTAVVAPLSGSCQITNPVGVRVEVSTSKRIYSRGEAVKFRAVLINNGKSTFYVSKSFSYASSDMNGKETPGF